MDSPANSNGGASTPRLVAAGRAVEGAAGALAAPHALATQAGLGAILDGGNAIDAALAAAGLATGDLAELDEEVGPAQVIAVGAGRFSAAADPRSDGAAAAW